MLLRHLLLPCQAFDDGRTNQAQDELLIDGLLEFRQRSGRISAIVLLACCMYRPEPLADGLRVGLEVYSALKYIGMCRAASQSFMRASPRHAKREVKREWRMTILPMTLLTSNRRAMIIAANNAAVFAQGVDSTFLSK